MCLNVSLKIDYFCYYFQSIHFTYLLMQYICKSAYLSRIILYLSDYGYTNNEELS